LHTPPVRARHVDRPGSDDGVGQVYVTVGSPMPSQAEIGPRVPAIV
jgi:hypothetical protein